MFDKFSKDKNLLARRRLHCNRCHQRTIHNLLTGFTGRWDDIEGNMFGSTSYSLYQCGGCDAVLHVTDDMHSEDYDYDDDGAMELNVSTKQYPSIILNLQDVYTSECPDPIPQLVLETASNLDANNLISATMLTRMIIEAICINLEIKGRDLSKKIDQLELLEIVDFEQKELLQEMRRRGNKVAHEISPMSSEQILAGFGVISTIIRQKYSEPVRSRRAVENAKHHLNRNE